MHCNNLPFGFFQTPAEETDLLSRTVESIELQDEYDSVVREFTTTMRRVDDILDTFEETDRMHAVISQFGWVQPVAKTYNVGQDTRLGIRGCMEHSLGLDLVANESLDVVAPYIRSGHDQMILDGVANAAKSFWEWIKKMFTMVADFIKRVLGISENTAKANQSEIKSLVTQIKAKRTDMEAMKTKVFKVPDGKLLHACYENRDMLIQSIPELASKYVQEIHKLMESDNNGDHAKIIAITIKQFKDRYQSVVVDYMKKVGVSNTTPASSGSLVSPLRQALKTKEMTMFDFMNGYSASNIDIHAISFSGNAVVFDVHMEAVGREVVKAEKIITKKEFSPHSVYTAAEYEQIKKMASASLRAFKEVGIVAAECTKLIIHLQNAYTRVLRCLNECTTFE